MRRSVAASLLCLLLCGSAHADPERAIEAAAYIAAGVAVAAESDDIVTFERTLPGPSPGAILRVSERITRVAPCVFERRHVRRVERDGTTRVVGARFERYDFSRFRVSRNLGGFVILEGRIGLTCLADGRGRADPMAVFTPTETLDCDGSIELQNLATGERYDAAAAARAVDRLRGEKCFAGY